MSGFQMYVCLSKSKLKLKIQFFWNWLYRKTNPSFTGHVAEHKRMKLFAVITVAFDLILIRKKNPLPPPPDIICSNFQFKFRKLRLRGKVRKRFDGVCDPISLNFE